MGTTQILWAEQSLRDARQRWYERRISIYFMANITGARSATMKMKKVGVTLKVTEKTKQPFHNLKVLKELLHQLNKFIQHFLECHGISVEANALSTTVDHIAAVAINATVQTTLHDYFTSWLFFFSVISHVKRVILTHNYYCRDKEVKSKIHC